MELGRGTRLGHFEIVSHLGAGGMGDVYEARDVRLERRVAVKVLPPAVANDPERLRRFAQEARTASNLNHPNIVTIYDVGDATVDGRPVHYIAMELIDGVTLRDRLLERPPLRQLLKLLAQAAEGLARAHAAGVVHRDLKPDNIMITRDGVVKILDFGLARSLTPAAAPPDDATQVREATGEGVVMGTVGYMAPEQVEGKTADARSDVFAFGCILYEALTGRRPFTGRSNVDVLHAVLHTEPVPITDLDPTLPLELRRIVKRCLAKSPDDRFQSVKDVAAHLHDLAEEFDTLTPPTGSRAVAVQQREPSRRWLWIAAVVVLVLAAGAVIAFFVTRSTKAPQTAMTPVTTRRITTSGNVANGTLSPDGKFVVLDLLEHGRHRLVMRQLASGSEVELEPPSDDAYGIPRVTGDGNYMYVARWGHGSSAGMTNYIERVPILGGKAERLVDDVATSPSLSPDESKMTFGRFDAEHGTMSIMIADVHGGHERVLWAGKWEGGTAPRWSPDGKWIEWPMASAAGGWHASIVAASPYDAKPVARPLTKQRFFSIVQSLFSPDGQWLWVTANARETDPTQLWRIDVKNGNATRVVTNDAVSYVGPTGVTADGSTLLLFASDERTRLVKVTASNEVVTLTPENERNAPFGFSLTAQDDVVFESPAAGSVDLWLLPHAGGEPQRLTTDPGLEINPAVGSDGTLYYLSHHDGTTDLDAMKVDGSGRRTVAHGAPLSAIDVSPDGRSIVTGGPSGISRIATTGGPRQTIYGVASEPPVYSPDGKAIAAFVRLGKNPRPYKLAILPADGGAPLKVFELPATAVSGGVAWTRDGRGLVYIDFAGSAHNLWVQPVDGGAPKQLTSFSEGQILSYAYAHDGSSLLISRLLRPSDAVLVSGLPRE